jgi:hypothetical protein
MTLHFQHSQMVAKLRDQVKELGSSKGQTDSLAALKKVPWQTKNKTTPLCMRKLNLQNASALTHALCAVVQLQMQIKNQIIGNKSKKKAFLKCEAVQAILKTMSASSDSELQVYLPCCVEPVRPNAYAYQHTCTHTTQKETIHTTRPCTYAHMHIDTRICTPCCCPCCPSPCRPPLHSAPAPSGPALSAAGVARAAAAAAAMVVSSDPAGASLSSVVDSQRRCKNTRGCEGLGVII